MQFHHVMALNVGGLDCSERGLDALLDQTAEFLRRARLVALRNVLVEVAVAEFRDCRAFAVRLPVGGGIAAVGDFAQQLHGAGARLVERARAVVVPADGQTLGSALVVAVLDHIGADAGRLDPHPESRHPIIPHKHVSIRRLDGLDSAIGQFHFTLRVSMG